MHKIMKFILYLFLSGAKWSHQTYHRQWHSVFSFRNCWNKCQVCEHFECLFNICQINDITTLSFCLWFYTNIMFIWLPFCYSTTYITCPADPKKTLGIKLPFLVMIIKNLKKYFTFEVQVCFWIISMLMNMRYIDKSLSALIVTLVVHKVVSIVNQVLDDKNVRRRFRASNYQSTTRVKPFICTMPMRLDDGWNQIQFNLSDFTRRAYGTNYIETLRVQVKTCLCRI